MCSHSNSCHISGVFFLQRYINDLVLLQAPAGSHSRGGHVPIYVFINQPNLPTPFLFCSCVCFCLYSPFNCISIHEFSRQISAFSLCSSGLISALMVLSTIYVSVKVSFPLWLSGLKAPTNSFSLQLSPKPEVEA